MILYFVRHGRAEERFNWPHAQDHLRPLTDEGIDRTRKSAVTIRKLGVKPDSILTSPLLRALQTAEILGSELACDVIQEESLADVFGLPSLAELLRAYSSASSLMLVGHEPDFSATVETLIGGGRVMVKKGSLIRVDLFSTKPPQGELVWSIPSKMLAL